MTRVFRGLAALLALAVLCLGVPAALLLVGRLDFTAVLTPMSPDDGTLLISLVTLAGWVAWLLLTVEVVTDLAAGLSRGAFTWRPATGAWVRPLTSVLVATVVAMVLAQRGVGTVPPPATVPTVATASAGEAHAPAQPEAETRNRALASHLVQPGEDLWGIAESLLGDGTQWRVIAELNPALAGGMVTPGMEITVPLSTPLLEDTSSQASDGFRQVTVVAGDSLWALAQKWLGDGERWPEIMRANPGLIGDPDEIEIGWVLRIPTGSSKEIVPTTQGPSPLSTFEDPQGRSWSPTTSPESAGTRASEPTSSTPAPPSTTPTPVSQSGEQDGQGLTEDPARLVAGGITAALALGIGTGLAARRRQQLAERALGRRVPHPGPNSARFATALGKLSAQAEQLSPTATSVLVGEDEAARSVLVDLGGHLVTAVVAETGTAVDLIGGMTTSLVCADWSADVLVTVVSEPLAWAAAFDHPGLTVVGSVAEALTRWAQTTEQRHQETGDGDDSPPDVYLFCEELSPSQLRLLATDGHPKMHAVVAQPTSLATETLTITDHLGTIGSTGRRFIPQLLGEPARRALVELHEVTAAPASTPGSWWYHPPEGVDPPTPLISRDRPTLPPMTPQPDDEGGTVHETPKLLLLGPIKLVGAQGPQPPRALRQLIEYCAWIHENPGRRSTQMTNELLVAESTRRSNMSRLRTWLGSSDGGDAFLPEAYTGHITLHPAVTSDWEMLQLKLAGGVNRASSQSLVDALTLVRGAPLADAAPGQWHWAEEMRSDMISTIRDVAVVLGQRALEISDLDTARWAVHRGLQAAPEDELLMGIKIRCEHLCGNRPEVERLVLQVTRQARLVGSDLHEETVALLQEVMEGRPRSQRA